MADNLTLPATGSVVRTIDHAGVETQVMALDFGGDGGTEQIVTNTNPWPVSMNAALFVFSTNNTSSAQLAAGVTFTGVIDTIPNQPSVSILVSSDQPILLIVYQYIDAIGTYAVEPIDYMIQPGGFSTSIPINGNYLRVTAQNIGLATTTTFNLNVAYGNIQAADTAGNSQSVLMGSNDFDGVSLLEECIKGTLPLSVNLVNPEAKDVNNALIISDAPTGVRLVSNIVGQQYTIDTQGYQSISLTTGTMVATILGCNDVAGTFQAILAQPIAGGAPVSTAAAATNYIIPCLTRYIRLTTTTLGWATYYLRSQPLTSYFTNLGMIGGVAVTQATSQLGINVVNVGGTAIQAAGIPVGASATSSTGYAGHVLTSAATTNATSVKATAGKIYSLAVSNVGAAAAYFKLCNTAAAPTPGTTVPILTVTIPASGTVNLNFTDIGLPIATGISYCITNLAPDADATAIAAGQVKVLLAWV